MSLAKPRDPVNPKWRFQRAENLPVYPFLAVEAMKAEVLATGASLIDLGLGNPDRPTPDAIVKRLHAAADVGRNHRYHPGRGLAALRTAIAAWYQRRYSVEIDPNRETIVTMGAKEGISHLCFATLAAGDVALVPDPCYPIHEGAPLLADASVERYSVRLGLPPADAVGEALERMRRAGRSPKLVVANYPQNPTGAVVTREELADLIRVVRDSGAMFLHDLAYADLDFATRHAPSIFDCGVDADEVKSFAVEVYSMSKSYNMPGWRIGYVTGNEGMIAALAHVKGYLDYGTFMPIQAASAWALDNGDALVDEIRALYQKRATELVQGLRTAGWGEVDEPRGTMFVWTRLPDRYKGDTSLGATRRLMQSAGVAVTPGSGFGPGGEGFVRFSLIEEPDRIAEACDRIRRALAG